MPGWKDGAQCAVMFTVDYDAETLWLSRDPENAKKPGILSQGQYAEVGVFKILQMLEEEGVKATFFIPGWVAEKYKESVKAINSRGHEIGHHGYLHERLAYDSYQEEEDIILKGLEILEDITGTKPVGYRSPAWEINPIVLKLLVKYNFLYSSNMMADIKPYWLEIEGHKSEIVELPVQWMLDDAPFFLFSLKPPSRPITPNNAVLSIWKDEFHGIYKEGGLFNLVVHPQFSGRPSRINMLKELFLFIKSFPNVWFATGKQVADYWKQNN